MTTLPLPLPNALKPFAALLLALACLASAPPALPAADIYVDATNSGNNGGMMSFTGGGANFPLTINGDFVAQYNRGNAAGAIYIGQAQTTFTGSLIFQRNFSPAQGGAVTVGNNSTTLTFTGPVYFQGVRRKTTNPQNHISLSQSPSP